MNVIVPSLIRMGTIALLVLQSVSGSPSAVLAQGGAPAEPASPRAPTYNPPGGTTTLAASSGLRLQGQPPSVGAIIVEDPLTAPGLIPGEIGCVTGLGGSDFTDGGYRFDTSGKCNIDSTFAGTQTRLIPGLAVPDGEVRFEIKGVDGGDRTSALIWVRLDILEGCGQGYVLEVRPLSGVVVLARTGGCKSAEVLAGRADLRARFAAAEWTDVSIRLHGPDIWVLVQGEPALSVSDSSIDHGGVSFGIARLGDLADTQTSAYVIRNLRVSALQS